MSRGRHLKCPRCNAPIDSGSGFGMVECPKCGEIVMVSDLPPFSGASPIAEPEPLAPFEEKNEIPLIESDAAKLFSSHSTPSSASPAASPLSEFLIPPATASISVNPNATQSRASVPKPGMSKGFNPDHVEFGQAPLGEPEIDLGIAEPFGGATLDAPPGLASSKTRAGISPELNAALETALALNPSATMPPGADAGNFAFTDLLQGHHDDATVVGAKNSASGEIAPTNGGGTTAGALGDLSDYANQSPTSPGFGGFGGLVYDVYIEGIDTSELRQDLSDCLSDPKLQLDKKGLMAQVTGGKLVLKDLNPVRASVILNQLKHLSFHINWRSHQLVKQTLTSVALLTTLLSFGTLTVATNFMSAIASSRGAASDWARHEVNLKGYATRINTMQEDIQALIIKKNQNKDPEVRDELLKQIIKQNEDLQKLYKDYKDEQEHIRFEHPEQGDRTERKYRHVKLKSLDELENEVGLDGQLSRIKRKVEQTYPTGDEASKPNGVKPSPTKAN